MKIFALNFKKRCFIASTFFFRYLRTYGKYYRMIYDLRYYQKNSTVGNGITDALKKLHHFEQKSAKNFFLNLMMHEHAHKAEDLVLP